MEFTFVTGTKKVRKNSGNILGSGKYIPKFTRISILYSQDQEQSRNTGRVKNSVELGFLTLYLTDPIKFIEPRNILAFDFTQIVITIFGLKIYQGYIRGGKVKEKNFVQSKLKEQAFFGSTRIPVVATRCGGGIKKRNSLR